MVRDTKLKVSGGLILNLIQLINPLPVSLILLPVYHFRLHNCTVDWI